MDMHPGERLGRRSTGRADPTWTPNLARARTAIDRATAPRRRAPAYRLAAAAAVALVAAVLLAPSGRAFAQELWYRFFVTRVQVVRMDLSRVPLDTAIAPTAPTTRPGPSRTQPRKSGYTGAAADRRHRRDPPVERVHPLDLSCRRSEATRVRALAEVGA